MPAAAEFISQREHKPSPAAAERAVRALTHDVDFRARAQQAWREAGGSASGYESLEQLISTPEFGEIIVDPESAVVLLGRFAERLAVAAAASAPSG